MERLFDLYTTYDEFKANVSSWSVDDDTIRKTIKDVYEEQGYVVCPHTACGEYVRRTYFPEDPTIVVSTAHPAKFDSVVEPLIGRRLPIPMPLYRMITKPSSCKSIGKDYEELFI